MTSLPSLSEIRALEEALHSPESRRDREAVEGLLAEGFVEFGASGRVYDRALAVSALMEEGGGGNANEQLESFNYALMPVAENAVLLTYETKRSNGDGEGVRVLRSSIWRRDGLKWQMLFHQGTIKP